MSIHIIKLVVGVADLHEFVDLQKRSVVDYQGQPANSIWTRSAPRQAEALIESGSIYRVIKNRIQCRQRIVGFEKVEHALKGMMTLIMVEPEIIQTAAVAKRPFQGWRYLKPSDAPPDIGPYHLHEERPPEDMAEELAALGLF